MNHDSPSCTGHRTIDLLLARWIAHAGLLETYGASDQAALVRKLGSEVQRAVIEHELEKLALDEAAKESGYAYSTIQQRVANGEIPNVGEKGAPRVRRCDLPRKAQPPRGRQGARSIADETLLRRQSA